MKWVILVFRWGDSQQLATFQCGGILFARNGSSWLANWLVRIHRFVGLWLARFTLKLDSMGSATEIAFHPYRVVRSTPDDLGQYLACSCHRWLCLWAIVSRNIYCYPFCCWNWNISQYHACWYTGLFVSPSHQRQWCKIDHTAINIILDVLLLYNLHNRVYCTEYINVSFPNQDESDPLIPELISNYTIINHRMELLP